MGDGRHREEVKGIEKQAINVEQRAEGKGRSTEISGRWKEVKTSQEGESRKQGQKRRGK
jgi:hypothetical protein